MPGRFVCLAKPLLNVKAAPTPGGGWWFRARRTTRRSWRSAVSMQW